MRGRGRWRPSRDIAPPSAANSSTNRHIGIIRAVSIKSHVSTITGVGEPRNRPRTAVADPVDDLANQQREQVLAMIAIGARRAKQNSDGPHTVCA